MRRIALWLMAGVLSVALTVLVFFPADWIASAVEQQTAGRFVLGDAQGTLWRGSAFLGGASGVGQPVTPLLPGRFSWRVSPLAMLGQVEMQVENPAALSKPVTISGTWSQWQVSQAALELPAERLAGLGAPLNTIQLSGRMILSWSELQIARQGRQVDLAGSTSLELNDIASRLSSIKPLGAYLLTMDWRGQQASLVLKTVKGPLLLNGSGALQNGRLQFSGKAEAEAGQEDKLANLLNLLGQRRKEGDKNVIALEFK